MHSQDPDRLRSCQYRDGANLAARQRLHRDHGQTTAPWPSFVSQQLRLPAQSRILEAVCGPGALCKENRELIPNGWWMNLSDLSPGMLAEAEFALLGISSQLTMRLADASRLPFPPASFDAPIANHMLYHVPNR
ncbi:transcriptional regulator, partial [mine drainage metagenome]